MTEEAAPASVSRRVALQRAGIVAGGAVAVWAAPSITTIGGAAFAAGSPPVGRTYTLFISLDAYPGVYDHTYHVTVGPAGSFTGTGSGIAGDTGTEVIHGTFSGGVLSYAGHYGPPRTDYSYTLSGSAVAPDGAFTGTIHTFQSGQPAGDYALHGTFTTP